MKILLIEPDSVLARSYEAALVSDSHIVAWVKSAEQAVQEADRDCPDAVILNIDMPRHNGMEFLYEFRSYTEWRHVPVVLLVSALNHDMSDQTVLREQLRVQMVLVKSRTTLKQLQAAVRELKKVGA